MVFVTCYRRDNEGSFIFIVSNVIAYINNNEKLQNDIKAFLLLCI